MKFFQILALAGLAAAVPADVNARSSAVSDSYRESTYVVFYEEDYYKGNGHYVDVTEQCISVTVKSIKFYHHHAQCTVYSDTACDIEIQTYNSDTEIFVEKESVKSFRCAVY